MGKVTFKIVLTSDPSQPYKTVSVPEEAPFSAVIKFVAQHFHVDAMTCGVVTKMGVGIIPSQTAGSVHLKHGDELKMIPREQVGH